MKTALCQWCGDVIRASRVDCCALCAEVARQEDANNLRQSEGLEPVAIDEAAVSYARARHREETQQIIYAALERVEELEAALSSARVTMLVAAERLEPCVKRDEAAFGYYAYEARAALGELKGES